MELDIEEEPFWQEAHEHVSRYEFEEAEKIFQGALTQYPNHPRILDALGGVLVQKGDTDKARMLAPEEGPEKYLNMGQISSGKESLEFYKKGIEILHSFMEHAPEEEAPFVVQQLISAYCSVAEIFMTDECFDPNAEQECGNALQAALKIDPNNYEALQTMASYKVSQQNPEEALNYLRQSFEKWKDITDPVDFPEFEFRVQTAKLFMELGDFRQAADILEALLNEDDEISELWYLLGFALVPLEPQSSLQCLTKARELLVKTNCTEREIFQQVDEQIKRVTEILEEIKAQGGDQVVEDAEMDAGEDDDFEGDGNQ